VLKKKIGIIFLTYLRLLSKLQLAKINFLKSILGKPKVRIIGITGSYGKTTTMLATVSALKDNFKVKFSEGANSESGIPLNILGLKMKDYSLFDWIRVAILSPLSLLFNWQDYDIYVAEMGIDEPKEPKNMGYLLKIIKPDIGVFVGVTSVHSQQFESVIPKNVSGKKRLERVLDAIADEKFRLISNLPDDGFAVLNLEDDFVLKRARLVKANLVPTKRIKIDFKDYVLPPEFEINFGLAVSVAKALGVDEKEAIRSVKKHFRLPPGRSSLIKGIKGTLIIDSSYNSSPKAAEVMLRLLSELGRKLKRKKIAVLGDMRELGTQSKIEHENLAKIACKIADRIVLVGPLMKDYFLPYALRLNYPRDKINHFQNAYLASEFLKKNIRGRELILVKGSQNNIFLEIVVKSLMLEKSKANALLCRQGDYWEAKRKRLMMMKD